MFVFFCLITHASSEFDTYGSEAPKPFNYHNKEFTAAAVSGMRHCNISKEEIERLMLAHPKEEIILDKHIALITTGCLENDVKCKILAVLGR